MKTTYRRLGGRRGFTLIELLTVLAIIAILASLITAAAQKIRITALITQANTEIGQFADAHQNFRLKYNLANKGNYIPSKIRLRESGDYDLANTDPGLAYYEQSSLNWLLLWRPGLQFPINWSGRDWTGDPVVNGVPQHLQYFDLEGDQALVFFLGGIPINGVPSGFSSNVHDPSSHIFIDVSHNPHVISVSKTVSANQFFEFKANRLLMRGGVTWNSSMQPGFPLWVAPANWRFPSYADPLSGIKRVQVYAYFSTYGKPNSYNVFNIPTPKNLMPPFGTRINSDCAVMAAPPPLGLNLANCNPQLATTNPVTFKNANGFQILSADYVKGDFFQGSFGPGS